VFSDVLFCRQHMAVGRTNVFCPVSMLSKVVVLQKTNMKHIHMPVVVCVAGIFSACPKDKQMHTILKFLV